MLRQKLSRGQVVVRLAKHPVPGWHGGLRRPHHLSRQLLALGHDMRLVRGQFAKPVLKGQDAGLDAAVADYLLDEMEGLLAHSANLTIPVFTVSLAAYPRHYGVLELVRAPQVRIVAVLFNAA